MAYGASWPGCLERHPGEPALDAPYMPPATRAALVYPTRLVLVDRSQATREGAR